jgi:acetyl esterase/lipase
MQIRVIMFVAIIVCSYEVNAQQIFPLYSGEIPNHIANNVKEVTINWEGKFGGYSNITQPTLEVYLPRNRQSNGSGVIICPGGGYQMESYQKEGINIAKAFVSRGVAAFILKYRLPSDSTMPDKSIGPLQDAQQAIKLVRQHAVEWKIDERKVGIMGFSAGGHLAATVGTHFDTSFIPGDVKVNLRPDFMILVYPVISFTDKLAHMGSRDNLIGKNPPVEKIKFFSNELHVTDNTPPTWLTHTGDDKVVDVDNSIVFYEALRHQGVPVEMHLYPRGDHGFVLNLPTKKWMQPLFEWMKKNNWMN